MQPHTHATDGPRKTNACFASMTDLIGLSDQPQEVSMLVADQQFPPLESDAGEWK